MTTPSFKSPPINEVAISVQFDRLNEFNIHHFGGLWELFRKEFPLVETHSPITPVIERFGVDIPETSPQSKFELIEELDLPRTWFISEDHQDLVQIQNDRFVRNWRRLAGDEEYPRYEKHIRPKFRSALSKYFGFVKENNFGEVRINQCELSYINIITPNRAWKDHSDIGKVFTIWNANYKSQLDLETESAGFTVSQIIKENGNPIGRLHIRAEPRFTRKDKMPVIRLSLIARGKPIRKGVKGAVEFADLGRLAIVNTFDKITSKLLHEEWGKE